MLAGPKRELWWAWYVMVAFYGMYSVVFFGLSRTQPPGRPWLDPNATVDWFAEELRRGALQLSPVELAQRAVAGQRETRPNNRQPRGRRHRACFLLPIDAQAAQKV